MGNVSRALKAPWREHSKYCGLSPSTSPLLALKVSTCRSSLSGLERKMVLSKPHALPPQGLCTTVPTVGSSAAEISSRSCWSQRDITSAECGFICFFTLASVCTHATCVCWNVGVTLPLLSWLWEPLSDPEVVLRRLQSGCMNESVGE